jgi:hypothetical protein
MMCNPNTTVLLLWLIFTIEFLVGKYDLDCVAAAHTTLYTTLSFGTVVFCLFAFGTSTVVIN